MNDSKLFTPCQIGPVTLRNRTIRASAFENMCYNNKPSEDLFNYHLSVAKGGIGMTNIAYAAVNRSGVSFDGQLWMREEIIPDLKKLTDAIHAEGAKAAIQLGHCGNMTHFYTCKQIPVGASTGFNLYSPTIVRGLKEQEIYDLVKDFGNAVRLARKAGFDGVEIHAGHGYLISQFLSPYTNHRRDKFGGSLENRMRFMQLVMKEVMEAAGDDIAVMVKTNMYDGFKSGMQIDECIEVAKELERLGAHALVLTAGFVSKAPMAVMRGAMPLKTLAHYMDWLRFGWLRIALALVGRLMIPTVPYSDAYFLEDAKKFRAAVKMPLIYVGGLTSRNKIDEVLNSGFVAVQMARALVHDPDFVNKMKDGAEENGCGHSNYCIGRMYTLEMKCHHCVNNLPKNIQKEIEKAEKMQKRTNKMNVIIKEVVSKRELKDFVTFPNKLYKDNPYYVPQLIQSDIDTLTPEKNHAFDVCEGKYWLAYKNGEIAGRIAGIINHEYNQRMGAVYVRFGWLDFIDDIEVSEKLIGTVEAWAKAQKAQFVCGPVGFLEFDVSGILVEGFDQLPTAYGKYNAPYYAAHIERLGYAKEVDWVEYQIRVPDIFPENVIEMSEKIAERYNVKLLQFKDKKTLVDRYCDKIFKLMNRQYERVHGYTKLSEGQIEDLKKQFIPLLNLKYVAIVVDSNDDVIGFAICLPSLSKALQKAKGHLYPFGFIHIMRALRKNDTIDSLLVAVATEYQNKGITAMMFNCLWKQMHDNGFTTIESTRQWEDNLHVRNLWNRFEYRLHKRARSFIKDISLSEEK